MRIGLGIAVVVSVSACVAMWIWLIRPYETAYQDVADPIPSEGASVRSRQAPVAETVLAPEVAVEFPQDSSAESPDIAITHDDAEMEDPTGDLTLYLRRPMSAVPHHVVRGWGAHGAGDLPGVVGAYVIVDPELTIDELTELARDIRVYHDDAEVLSVRILDSERAATYDRHIDGGALAAAHLVGLLNRNARLGLDRIEIRGRAIDVSD